MNTFYKELDNKIQQAVKVEMQNIQRKIGKERIYAVALVTDSDCVTLFLAVNTYEYLQKRDKKYAKELDLSEEDLKNVKEGSVSLTQWIPDEWGYSDGKNSQLNMISELLFEHDESEEYDEESYEENQRLFFETVTSAMEHLIAEKVFGEYSEEITFFISMSDDERTEEIENYSAKLLNSADIYENFYHRNIF